MNTKVPRRRLGTLALAALAMALPWPSAAQPPDRITIVVPYPPGSAPDTLARQLATKLAPRLGRSVIVDNRPGANAIIGSDYVSKAKNDGSTYLLVDRMTVVVNPLLFSKLPYEPAALVPVSDVARVNLLLSVRGDEPVKDWASFVAYAKNHPEAVAIGTGGPGSVHHLSLELLSRAIEVRLTHVPYKGIAPAVQDVLAGQLFGVISGPEVVLPHLEGGRLRPLVTGAKQRAAALPQVPTLAEQGVGEAVLLPTTFSVFAPPRTSAAVANPFGDAVRAVLSESDTAVRLAPLGLEPAGATPQQMQAALAEQGPQLTRVIREAGIKLD
ncbi:MAG TPA: tripartite tricarboxylate transporter substrate binding protein [Pseudorhodoferax sp.]|nr:tripartite tricarboxylate transporter substrate binding protein [Pseudorhodoferax sp.]